jgi:hypothetical protein
LRIDRAARFLTAHPKRDNFANEAGGMNARRRAAGFFP